MRKFFILVLLMTLQMMARGQTAATFESLGLPHPTTAKSMRYWIDDDAESVKAINDINGKYTIDMSALIEGLHTIHYQIIDNEGKVAIPYSGIFLTLPKGDYTQANKLRYWFDDATDVRTCNTNAGIQTLDASSLLDGVHTLHYQVVDTEGQVSYIASDIFLKIKGVGTDENISASKLVYWFDDQETTTIEMTSGIQVLDASNLLNGLHTIHYMVVCSDGSITSAYSSIFMRMDIDAETTAAKSLRYWFDDENDATEVEMTAEVQTLDVSHLLDGLHTVHYQLIDNKGMSAIPMSSIFMKMTGGTSESSAAQSLRYWFDDDTDVTVTSVACGTQSLDVTGLHTGLHTLHYQLIDDKGNACIPMSGIFMKMFDKNVASEENVITQYMYWMNDESKSNNKVVINKPTSPYQLITLLPMIKAPIRSSCFHFEVKNGVPMIYAKNDLHIRFEDAAGYWADASKSFIDYSVSEKVKVTKLLTEVFGYETFPSPKNGEIKWYAMECEKGDSITVKSSQATSIQIFAPSGDEVYSVSGSESVALGGLHAYEYGTYYFAIHDVTGSKSEITLDYQHIDKYAILDYDVNTVGNGGCSTIMFQGNGFRDLYAVDLYTAHGDTIHAVDIGHQSDANTTVTFDFTDAVLGKYNAKFRFAEGDKTITNCITVNEEKPIEIATNVTFPSSYGHVVTYTCKITNMGNMTAYAVPIYIWMKSKQEKGICDVRIEGLDLPRLSDYVSSEVLTQSEVAEMKTALDAFDDDYYFMKFWVEDEDSPSDSVCVRSNYFFTNLAPGETKTLRLTISTSEVDAFAYFTLPEEWPSYSIESGSPQFMAKARFASAKSESWYCCYRDRIECVANIICNGLDIASLFSGVGPNAVNIASCAAGGMNQVLTAAGDHYCGKNDVEGDFVKKVNNIVKGINVAAVLTGCASAFGVKNASEIAVALDAVTHPFVTIDCLTSFFSKKPNCPPTPPDGGGTHGGKSHDPNEIYGYLSQSGSKFLADSVRNVNYRIEFENDTAFATASAHVVEVKDTLDGKYFDLATFAPTSVKIGDKVEYLDGTPNFVKTIDMRPAINAIAQVEGEYDVHKGIATWTFTSLDPMTMEPTDDIMQGFLPVNYDGESGIGEVMFDVSLKGRFADGTEIPNKASIVFDINEPILTPTWVNTVDAVCPESHVTNVVQQNDSIATIYFEGDDARSGVWKYNLYVQYGDGSSWIKFAECGADSSYVDFRYSDGLDYGFCVLATDSAGNVEKKELTREGAFVKVNLGDVNCDGEVNTLDASLTTGYYLEQPVYILAIAADVNGDGVVNTLDATQITQMYLNANNASRTKTMGTRKRLIKTKSTKQ